MTQPFLCPHCGKDVFAGKDAYSELIEYYYRVRGQGKRITLREVAELGGVSYNAIRKRKMSYDAAHAVKPKKPVHTYARPKKKKAK